MLDRDDPRSQRISSLSGPDSVVRFDQRSTAHDADGAVRVPQDVALTDPVREPATPLRPGEPSTTGSQPSLAAEASSARYSTGGRGARVVCPRLSEA